MQQSTHRTSETGGVLSFIVVTIVLIGLLVGGFYLIHNRSNQIANTPPEIAAENEQGNPENGQQSEAQNDTEEPANQGNPQSSGGQESEDKPSTAPAPNPAPSSPQSSPESIAETGPAETLMTMLVFGAIAASSTAYLQSRKTS